MDLLKFSIFDEIDHTLHAVKQMQKYYQENSTRNKTNSIINTNNNKNKTDNQTIPGPPTSESNSPNKSRSRKASLFDKSELLAARENHLNKLNETVGNRNRTGSVENYNSPNITNRNRTGSVENYNTTNFVRNRSGNIDLQYGLNRNRTDSVDNNTPGLIRARFERKREDSLDLPNSVPLGGSNRNDSFTTRGRTDSIGMSRGRNDSIGMSRGRTDSTGMNYGSNPPSRSRTESNPSSRRDRAESTSRTNNK